MKKLLVSLTILFSVFIGVNSVNAEELSTSNLFNYIHFTNMYGMTDDEMLSLGTSVDVDLTDFVKNYNIHKEKLTLKNFIFRYDGGTGVTIFYKSNDTWTINLKDNSTYYSLYVEDRNTASKVSVKYNSWGGTTLYSPSQSAYTLGQLSNIKKDVAKEYYFFYISDLEEDIYLKYTASLYGSGWLTSDITIDNNIYSINDSTPISLRLGYNSLKEDKPKLTYKTGFVSSEAYSVLGKVSVDFSETDKNIYKYKISQFKLQFGSNDFSRENIPIYSHYKVFGKRNDTWTELSEEDLKIPYAQDSNGDTLYDDRRLITIDTTYDYSEGMLADASITLQINYSNLVDINTTDPIYTDWKIEFYFDNTNNGYIYVYDTLDSSKWTDTAKIFSDYIFYYFPPQYRYAFISSEENTSTGRIYFPSNSYMNEAVRLKGFYYHYNINWVGDELKRIISEDDQYYSYFDYKFSYDDKQCVVLSRKMAAAYQGYYDPDFLNNYMKLFPDEQIIINTEISYFYAPIGVKVTFAKNTSDTIIIHTPEGVIKNDSNTIYDSTDYDINFTYNNVDDLFSHLTNFFSESIPYMKPLVEIFNNFYKSLNEYIRAFIEFLCIFILVAAVVLWLNKRSEK